MDTLELMIEYAGLDALLDTMHAVYLDEPAKPIYRILHK